MQSLSKVLTQDEGPGAASAANHHIMAPPAVGHQHCRQVAPAQDNYTFTVVAVKYFAKWVEVKPFTNVSTASIKKFFWQNSICRCGIPRHFDVVSAKYFDNAMFKDFLHQI
jgi:hypothetical protein